MSAKTKIVVLRMKNIVLTGIILGAVILAAIIIFTILLPNRSSPEKSIETGLYTPGVYNSSVSLSGAAIDVSVTVDANNIKAVTISNLSESVETMYPLVAPAMEEISLQVIENQTTDNITYSENNKYTSMVLMEAINKSIDKAKTPSQ